MSMHFIQLLVDFGLVVLIWIIQLIIYPSFLYYKTENLIIWHKNYMPLIGYIVGPLMLLQLALVICLLIRQLSVYNGMSLVLIGIIWIVTFLQFVPIHKDISKGSVTNQLLLSLVKKNWLRTILWTVLFVFNLTVYAIGNFLHN